MPLQLAKCPPPPPPPPLLATTTVYSLLMGNGRIVAACHDYLNRTRAPTAAGSGQQRISFTLCFFDGKKTVVTVGQVPRGKQREWVTTFVPISIKATVSLIAFFLLPFIFIVNSIECTDD